MRNQAITDTPNVAELIERLNAQAQEIERLSGLIESISMSATAEKRGRVAAEKEIERLKKCAGDHVAC